MWWFVEVIARLLDFYVVDSLEEDFRSSEDVKAEISSDIG